MLELDRIQSELPTQRREGKESSIKLKQELPLLRRLVQGIPQIALPFSGNLVFDKDIG